MQYHKHNWIIPSVLTIKWYPSILVGNMDTPSVPAFFVCGIEELERSVEMRETGLKRPDLKPGDPSILHKPHVDRKKIIASPLHIKLGLIKQFVKALKTEGDSFKYLILGIS